MKTIRQAREEKHLSRFQLAVKAGVAPDTVTSLELKRQGTTLQTLTALCKVLEIDPREIEGVVIRRRTGKVGWTVVEDPFNVSAE